ncbi:argininosuccinate lyase [Clostridium sp. AN503]|uniref:argininosuccinate lyase n=1 Tax=Clostridium sp. AN503 TaxID=3160598 RepID=UPI0034596AA9
MRKQTKVVAVASAAALLAIGASMTSFAATGWVEEDGQWYFYDKDGNRVEDEWKKSGDNWYWMDSEEGGAMATDKLIDDEDDTYYVDSNGVMVKNTWVKVVNEDQDDDDPAEYHYYYMQGNGKAYKASNNTSTNTKFKTIDGKRYAFDDEGVMLYGWVDDQANRLSDDSGWSDVNTDSPVYYLGSWEDGAMKTGWQKITVYDDQEDEDMDHWFYFQSNGKRFQKSSTTTDEYRTKTVNGKKYAFDNRGVMVYTWAIASVNNANTSSGSNWGYFNSPEDGARITKGWFKVVPPNEDNTFDATFTDTNSFDVKDADDEDENWYYANGDGTLETGKIKKIKGKYYGFMPDDGREGAGKMMSGLNLLDVDANGNVIDVKLDDMDSDDIDDLLDGDYDTELASGYTLYYFGNDGDVDGAMKTGNVTVSIDGSSYSMQFSKSGGAEGKGRGVTGIDDKKYIYKAGIRMKAGSDDKYKVIKVTSNAGTDVDINATGVSVTKISGSKLRGTSTNYNSTGTYRNKDGDSLTYYKLDNNNYYLVNSSGSVVKNKASVKDGDDWFFFVDNYDVKLYTNEKVLKPAKVNGVFVDNGANLEDWKNGFVTPSR